MKIELIKKTDINGDAYYFTTADGNIVPNTLSLDLDKAHTFYEKVVNGAYSKAEVIKSIEIK